MANYIKIDGEWVESSRPYVKRTGVWVPVVRSYVKRSGVWVQSFEYDVTPSAAPLLSLELIQNRYIRIGARLPGLGHDGDLKRIRVLASRKEMPTTQFGAGYQLEEDNSWQKEPWSDWYYNDANPAKNAEHHLDSSVYTYKQFPINPTDSTDLPGGQFYYFAAWSEDLQGNWSVGTYQKIWMPKKGTSGDRVVIKEARFQANDAGSAGVNGASYTDGDLTVRESPRSNGFWFYGNKITEAVGERGTPTIRSAQLRVTRSNDSGEATANVRAFWHGEQSPSDMPMLDSNMGNIALLGTINKGETKWFDLPESYYSHFNTGIKGLGLVYGIQASDYLVVSGLATDLRCGEVNLVWEEAL